jgi:hypothetical protein
LTHQQLKTRLQDVQQQISGVKQQIRNRLKLMKLFKQQTDIQKNLQRNYARQQIKQYEGQQIQSQAVQKN